MISHNSIREKIRETLLKTQRKNSQSLAALGVFVVDGTGLEFANCCFLLLFSAKYVIFSSEIIKFCTSQSSCFIEDDPLKGQNKGQIQARERTVTQWKSLIGCMEIFMYQTCLYRKQSQPPMGALGGCALSISRRIAEELILLQKPLTSGAMETASNNLCLCRLISFQ